MIKAVLVLSRSPEKSIATKALAKSIRCFVRRIKLGWGDPISYNRQTLSHPNK